MADVVQMNTRIDRALKERGDEALARAGYSPSHAVRKLWERAAAHAQDPRAIRELLDPSDNASDVGTARGEGKGSAWRRQAVGIATDAFRQLGLAPSRITAESTYEELRDFAYEDRLCGGDSRG